MDPKQKLTLIACGAIAGLIIIALGGLLFVQIGAMGEARNDRDAAKDSLNDYYSAEVYPSKANRDVREADAKKLNAWADAAKELLAHGLEIPQGESPSQFKDRLSETVRALNERQEQKGIEKKNSAAEPPLDYAFGRYVTQNEMPKEEDVPRLSAQFAVISHVATLLLDNGATKITAVTRDTFDNATDKPKEEEQPRARRSRRNRNAEAEKPVAATGAPVDPALAKDGVTCEHYTIKCEARYPAIAKTLNDLVQGDLFVVVTDVALARPTTVKERVDKLVKERQSARQAEQKRKNRNKKADEIAAEEPAEEKPLFDGVPPVGRLVSDPEHALPLNVTLAFDVYTLPPAPAAEGEAAAPATPAKEGN